MKSNRSIRQLTLLVLASTFGLAGAANSLPIRFAGQNAELTIAGISPRTVRIQLSPLDDEGKPRPFPSSTVLVPFPSTDRLRVRELAGEEKLNLGQVTLEISPQPLRISLRRANGSLVQELTFDDTNTTNAGVAFRTSAPVLGLGEGAQQFDRRGSYYPMLNGQRAPFLATHGGTIPVPFLLGTDGWALFVHHPWGEFDLRGGGRFIPRTDAAGREPLELFVVDSPEPADALAEYLQLTGHPLMPPKWVMGYMQSHRTLSGPDEPLQIAKAFREKNLPCDAVIYLGTGYCTNGWNVANGTIDFNTNAFPHPAEQIKSLHAEHFKVILHVNQAPRNLFGTSIGQASASTSSDVFARGPYLTLAQRRALAQATVTEVPEDFNAPLHIRNYWAWHRPVFGLGVDGWWPDDGDELPIEARLARHRCYYEGSLQDRPGERPWSLHRNGFAGVQRYGGWIWSGDVQSRWATLAAHVPVGINYSLSVTPFWGTDTGGFIPTRDLTGELYTRWFQFSAFNPLFRSHGRTWKLRLPWGWNTGETGPVEERVVPDAAELHNPEVEPICRKYLELRYRLLPYNYTLIREACDTGLPPMRALWLHYPKDAEAVKLGDEYLWGRDFLVAPVVEKGARTRRVYLPAGDWYDWWSGEKVAGGSWIDRSVDLATMPLYVRAGAIIPLDPLRQYTSQPVNDPTTLRIHPGANGLFTLYDDDGQSTGWRDGSDGKTVWIRCLWDDSKRRLTLEPDVRMKNWPGGMRFFSVEIAGGNAKPRQVEFRGNRTVIDL